MALKGFWGFDSCAVFKYPEFTTVQSITATGRDGVANHATQFDGNTAGGTLTVPGGASSGLIIGAAWNVTTTASNAIRLAQFRSGASVAAYVGFTATGQLALFNAAGTQLAVVPAAFTLSVWNYVEIKYVPHASAGVCIVRVNETEVINLTGATASGGITAIDNIYFESRINNTADDMYLLDLVDETATAGRPNNDFLGDVRVAHLLPTADGSAAAWTPSTAGAHFGLVDEVPPNTTDYVSSLGGGTVKDFYQMSDLPSIASVVFGVRTLLYAGKTDAGAAAIKAAIRESDGSETIGAAQNLAVTFTGYGGAFHKVKSAGGVFTPADINALQVGAQVA
jgi:hypothetical protein